MALPLVFIIVISIVIFTPSLFIRPMHDFVYTEERGDYYNRQYQNTYKVENDRIALDPIPVTTKEVIVYENGSPKKELAPKLYRYTVKTNSVRQIDFDEAKNLMLDPGPSSPDGYTISYQYGHSGIFELFGSNGNDNGYFISKGSGKKRLSGLVGDNYRYSYQGNFKLIGWIK